CAGVTGWVVDAALAMSVLAGRALEPQTVSAPRIAFAPELLERASPEVAAHVQAVADALVRAGATVSKVELPASFRGIHAAGLTAPAAQAAPHQSPPFARHADADRPEKPSPLRTGRRQTAPADSHPQH